MRENKRKLSYQRSRNCHVLSTSPPQLSHHVCEETGRMKSTRVLYMMMWQRKGRQKSRSLDGGFYLPWIVLGLVMEKKLIWSNRAMRWCCALGINRMKSTCIQFLDATIPKRMSTSMELGRWGGWGFISGGFMGGRRCGHRRAIAPWPYKNFFINVLKNYLYWYCNFFVTYAL